MNAPPYNGRSGPVLSSRMPWQEIEARVAHLFVRKAHAGEAMPELDYFGEKPQRVATPSNAGRPRVPLRVMIALLYLVGPEEFTRSRMNAGFPSDAGLAELPV